MGLNVSGILLFAEKRDVLILVLLNVLQIKDAFGKVFFYNLLLFMKPHVNPAVN